VAETKTFAGKYELGKRLGSGGSGTVYQATNRNTGAQVAIKIMHPGLSDDPSRNARVLARVERVLTRGDYTNLVRTIEVLEDGDALGIVMELVEGETLRSFLNRAGPLTPDTALPIFAQVLRGLSELHAREITHRDVKPSNILLEKAGKGFVAKLADFGIAEILLNGTISTSREIIGTPAYIAPEVVSDPNSGTRSTDTWPADIYSAGIVLYEMLAGQPPFTADTAMAILFQQVSSAPPPIEGLWDDKSGLRALVERLLAKNPQDRPSADEALALLERIEPSLAAKDTPSPQHDISIRSDADHLQPGRLVLTDSVSPAISRIRSLVASKLELAARLSALAARGPLRAEEVEHQDGTLRRFEFGPDEFLLVDRLDGKPTLNWTTGMTPGDFAELVDQYLEDDTGKATVTVGIGEVADEMSAEIAIAFARLGGDFDRECNFFRFDTAELSLAYQVLPNSGDSGRTSVLGVTAPRLTLDRVLPLIMRTGTEQVIAHTLSVRVDALPSQLSALLAAQETPERELAPPSIDKSG
jgi:serine/threonine protein kinase